MAKGASAGYFKVTPEAEVKAKAASIAGGVARWSSIVSSTSVCGLGSSARWRSTSG